MNASELKNINVYRKLYSLFSINSILIETEVYNVSREFE